MAGGEGLQIAFEFRLAQGAEEFNAQAWVPYLQQIFQYAVRFVRLEPGAVEKIVIADAPLFGQTIYEYQDRAGRTRGYSDKGYLTAVSKNISRRTEDGRITSTIIIQSGIMGGLVEMCVQGVQLEDWDVDHRFWFYILIQELSRSQDNSEREFIGDRDFNFEEEYDEIPIATHYVPIVVGNLIVGAYGGLAVTPELQQYLINSWHATARDLVEPLLDRKMAWAGITTIVRDAANVFWALLFQYANLFGNTLTNPELEKIPAWRTPGEEEESALRLFDQVLTGLWDLHPQLPPEDQIVKQVLPIWRAVMEAHGFGYEEAKDSEPPE